ncbi:MAG: hypothetical protein PHR77_01990 [Kiritimatiellae bacterium]|nr:hypothetical protein [Kiritimatiellia bacterium]
MGGNTKHGCSRLVQLFCLLVCVFLSSTVTAQTLRFSNHREVSVPEYAVLRIGPFYSSVTFSQSAGYRYTKGDGNGIDYLFENQRGVFLKDGSDFPLVSTLDVRNYLVISRTTDLDISLRASYAHYPQETQEDEFIFDFAEEGLVGNISMEFNLTPYVKGTAFNNLNYRTDYIDTRGLIDRYGGEAYEHLQNNIGLNLDWLMAKDQNLGLSLSRMDVLPRGDKFNDQESISYSETLTYQQMINPLVMAGASAAFGQYSYTAATNRPDTSFQTYSVFATAKLTERTTGSASIGYSKASFTSTDPSEGNGVDDGGVIGSISIKTKMDRNLEHEIGYARSQPAGFNSPFEINDKYRYQLNWKNQDMLSASLFSEYNMSSPSSEWMGEYTDWISGINASYPVTSIIALNFSTVYSIRENNDSAEEESTDIEWKNNYTTWSSQIGTSFAVTKELGFSTYIQHIERSSDSVTLEYSRDIFVATFTYTHQF